MRYLEDPVFTISDLKQWLNDHSSLDPNTTVWLSTSSAAAKPLRNIYVEDSMQICENGRKPNEAALILDMEKL